jgi:LysM repeat protein
MKIKRIIGILISVLFLNSLGIAQTLSQAYLSYIDQYHKIAQKQQREHGVPASITLAQGLLESGAGQSYLSKSSNNHFGIKCSDWQGEKIYYDDDTKDECFRKYSQVLDSYEDHCAFLKTRPRYASLFELKPTDYEGWAFGLKKAGYATDPTYAYKLISIVENYSLHKFDIEEAYAKNSTVSEAKLKTNSKTSPKRIIEENTTSIGFVKASTTHELKRVNGVIFVTATAGDSFGTIADEFNIGEARLRRYNDVDSYAKLAAGDRVFLAIKKDKAENGYPTHRILYGESMRSISQDYAVKVTALYKLNNMPFEEGAKLGQVLVLR